MCFADFIESEETRSLVGMSMIVCVSFNLVINIGYIMLGAIKDACTKAKVRYYTWKKSRKDRNRNKQPEPQQPAIDKSVVAPESEEENKD